jgi:hypothetical protein
MKSSRGTTLAFHNAGKAVTIPAQGWVVVELGDDGKPHGWVTCLTEDAFRARYQPACPGANAHLPVPEKAGTEEERETVEITQAADGAAEDKS